MKWLKLDCDFRNDPKIQALAREWGMKEAAGFWTLLLAFVAGHGGIECRVKIDPLTELSDLYLAEWFASKPQVIFKCLSRAAQLSLICQTEWENNHVIFIPNLLKRMDTYAQRVRTHFEQSSKKSALEEEVDIKKKEIEERNRKTVAAKAADLDLAFQSQFWTPYPKKVGKVAALKIWRRLHPSQELQRTISSAIAQQKSSSQWLNDNGRYIPNPATWLNQGRWDDALEPFQRATLKDAIAPLERPSTELTPAEEAFLAEHKAKRATT